MYRRNAHSELEEIKKVKKFIETIPNKDDYFIVSTTFGCSPAKITEPADLSGFDEKCSLFTDEGINQGNVNTHLDKLALIIMPNGGSNIQEFFIKISQLPKKEMELAFVAGNTALIKLLVNGIQPLTAQGFNHNDIKAGNIVMSADGHARLIDWGLASASDGVHIPEMIQNRPIAFNMPFSDIFFNTYVKDWLPEALRKATASTQLRDKNIGQREVLKMVAVNMINESILQMGEGQYDYVTQIILHDIYKIYAMRNGSNHLDYNVLATNALIDYVHAVLLHYVDDKGTFQETRYFYDVFSKNVDNWGFLLAYVPIIEYAADKFSPDLVDSICRILLKYCFSTEFAIKAIDIKELALDLQSLNGFHTTSKSHWLSKSHRLSKTHRLSKSLKKSLKKR
jgi:serine/threonine protein kinase